MSDIQKRSYLLPALFITVLVTVGYLGCVKYCDNQTLPNYSKAHIIRNVRKPKNIPLIEELFKLNEEVREVVNDKPGGIADEKKRSTLILLTKLCKDSCKAIRCRIDSSLGHACRQSCPTRKIRYCLMATKRLPDEPSR